ncbi:MAG TPA: hypothetical protein VKV17_18630 [Bryobacteraceae bacterium]|nr:hypothetical protein [Bryobacteraceae bacterium]
MACNRRAPFPKLIRTPKSTYAFTAGRPVPGGRLPPVPAKTASMGRGGVGLPAEETLATKDGAALRGFERNGRFTTALGTTGYRLGFAGTERRALALALASLAALGFIFEVLVVEEVLLSRCKYKFRSAIYAFENAILEIRHKHL